MIFAYVLSINLYSQENILTFLNDKEIILSSKERERIDELTKNPFNKSCSLVRVINPIDFQQSITKILLSIPTEEGEMETVDLKEVY